jgi:hypothetical protein
VKHCFRRTDQGIPSVDDALTSRFESEPNPRQGDVGLSGTPAMKVLAFIHRAFDEGTVSMELDQLAAADVPHEAGTAKVHERALAMATEQGLRIPTSLNRVRCPFGGQKLIAVHNKLAPPVRRDVGRRTILLERGDSHLPIALQPRLPQG